MASDSQTTRFVGLASLRELQDGWNGGGSKRPDDECLDITQVILSRPPSICPVADGSIQLEWHVDGFDLELWITLGGGKDRIFTDDCS